MAVPRWSGDITPMRWRQAPVDRVRLGRSLELLGKDGPRAKGRYGIDPAVHGTLGINSSLSASIAGLDQIFGGGLTIAALSSAA